MGPVSGTRSRTRPRKQLKKCGPTGAAEPQRQTVHASINRRMSKASKRRRPKRRSWFFDYRINWHNVCLAVFLSIVVMDMVLFPIWHQFLLSRLTPEKMIQLTQQFPQASDRLSVLQVLMTQDVWHPLTLESGGVFYMAFGAILGIGAWRRCGPNYDIGRDRFGERFPPTGLPFSPPPLPSTLPPSPPLPTTLPPSPPKVSP